MSLGSLKFTVGVAVFIRSRWFHSCSPWGSMGSSGDVEFPGVPLVVVGSLGFALRVVEFMRGRWVHSDSH